MKPDISIVVPAYNEVERIGDGLNTIIEYLAQHHLTAEIIVVDDGSPDETAQAAEKIFARNAKKLPTRIISYQPNRGKGCAVRTGLAAAAGTVALFSDADLSTPISEMNKMIAPIREGTADITIGSRALDRNLIGTHQSWTREQGGKVFNLVVRLSTGLPFADTQCGFKAFRTALIQPILQAARVERFGFDVELLLIAFAAGLRIEEIPVRWNHSEGSKVDVRSDSWKMFKEVLSIRRNMRRGLYQSAVDEIKSLTKMSISSQSPVKRRPRTAGVKRLQPANHSLELKGKKLQNSAKN